MMGNSKSFRSPFNGATQTVRYPGSRWRCSIVLRNLKDAQARRIEALIASMDGEYGRIKLWDHGRTGRATLGVPIVAEAEQAGVFLKTRGWTPNSTVLKMGDYITVNDELKMIVEDVSSDLTGAALLHIAPMLRSSPDIGAPIETRRPYGIFKLVDNDQGESNRVPGIFTSINIDFEEAF
jgi:hypothetical protein